MVEENHNLIYWYINTHSLDINEWYDLLAIELCYTVMKYDESKGSLSNYYKLRCDGLVSKEYRKSQAQKRLHIGITYMDELSTSDEQKEDDNIAWVDFINCIPEEDRQIVELIYHGYTQQEVAKKIGVTQSYVSKIMKRIRKEFHGEVDG